MSDYTPTTEEVRTDYVVAYTNAESSQLLAGMAFDRWLAQHDREVAAQTLIDEAERVHVVAGMHRTVHGVATERALRGQAAHLRSGGAS